MRRACASRRVQRLINRGHSRRGSVRCWGPDGSRLLTAALADTLFPPDGRLGMACTNGRARLGQDDDRRLFVESAGTCLLCNARLFADALDGSRSISIAERAHIVAHSPAGPRGKESAPNGDRDGAANIVLLCPSCHTLVDKDPARSPASELFERKHARASAVALVGGTPVFEQRTAARQAVEKILTRNRLIWEQNGPDLDGSLATSEDADRWNRHVIEDIVPGNELLVALVLMNDQLTTPRERITAERLRLHTNDLRSKHLDGVVDAPARRFPPEVDDLFGPLDD